MSECYQDSRWAREPLVVDAEMHEKVRMKIYQDYSDLDLWLLYGILKGIPPFYANKGVTHFNLPTTMFLLENELAIAFTTGLIRTTRGDALLYFLEKDPPEPGTKMYPRDIALLPSASQANHFAIWKPGMGPQEKNTDTSGSSQDQPQ